MGKKTVYIIDDEPSVLELIETLAESAGLTSKTFLSAQDFINFYEPSHEGCIVLDINMPDMNGLELQKKMNNIGCILPVIFLTGHGNVLTAVEAMKAGAFDFFEKPYNGKSLLESIHIAFEKNNEVAQSINGKASEKLSTLTPRENEVMKMLASLMSNKEIARDLDISPRTVEVHRQHIMKKLDIRSVSELSKIVD